MADPAAAQDDNWDRPLRAVAVPVLAMDGFGGPLDLLLDLAERQQLDLGCISVLALAEQFAAEQERLQPLVPLERRAEWVGVAARLLLLRSRLLVAGEGSAAASSAARAVEDEAARLRAMLAVRAAADWLSARPQLGHDTWAWSQAGPGRLVFRADGSLPGRAARTGGAGRGRENRPPLHGLFSVSEAVVRIRALLGDAADEALAFQACLPRIAAPTAGTH